MSRREAEILLGDGDVSQVRKNRRSGSQPGGYAWVFPIVVMALPSSDRTPGRRTMDREVQSYLADVESFLLRSSLHESQLEEALATRTTIGQAVGLLMAQEGLTSEQAFQKLVQLSQTSNVKLRDIAERYVRTWEEKVQGSSR